MPEMHDGVLVYATDIEQETIDQAKQAAGLPWVQGHVALMPDAHVGKGSTVGSVIPTKGAIMPAAVGVDIGCGMIAVETSLTAEHLPDNLGPLHGMLREAIPAGMGKGYSRDVRGDAPKHWPEGSSASRWLDQKQLATAVNQFGTLGGGNHFVEVCLDESQAVWVVLHSGSRGVGNQLATQHIECAKGIMARYFIDLPDPDLAFLAEGTEEFDAYIGAMLWAQEYAMGNRETMMDAALAALVVAVFGSDEGVIFEQQRINCHHNYTERENHMGQNVWLTRKGAIRAREGDKGIIPGSMGTSSFIVSGKGCIPAYHSCSHGAGRRMSRGEARRSLDVDAFREQMAGRTWDDRDAEALLDEAPDSYKDVQQVIRDSAELVTVEHELTAVLNMKGVDTGPRRKGNKR
jgi:tRNA-splicing ligase RtcB